MVNRTLTIFSEEQLARLVAETLPPDAKPGEKIVVATVDQQGAKIVAAFKLQDHWELQGAARADWTGDVSAGVKIIGRF